MLCHCVHAMYLSPASGAGAAVPELRLQPGAAAASAAPQTVSRSGKLTPAAEARLLVAFGLQDTLTREEAVILAEQASSPSLCTYSVANIPCDNHCKPLANQKTRQLLGQCLVLSPPPVVRLRLHGEILP